MANRLMTTDEAVAAFKQDIDRLVAEHCRTDEDRWQVLDAFSRMMGGPGVERPPSTVNDSR